MIIHRFSAMIMMQWIFKFPDAAGSLLTLMGFSPAQKSNSKLCNRQALVQHLLSEHCHRLNLIHFLILACLAAFNLPPYFIRLPMVVVLKKMGNKTKSEMRNNDNQEPHITRNICNICGQKLCLTWCFEMRNQLPSCSASLWNLLKLK